MFIQSLTVNHLRNLASVSVEPGPRLNLLHGDNGSGKTSILEALYFLGMGRSFRTRNVKKVIHYDKAALMVHGKMADGTLLGIEKASQGKTQIKINGENYTSAVALAERLPLLFMDPSSVNGLASNVSHRRQALDWCVFHVEHAFITPWKRLNYAIKQRNAALKSRCSNPQIVAWNKEIVEAGLFVHRYRSDIFASLNGLFNEVVRHFLPDMPVEMKYQQGWPEEVSLGDQLAKQLEKDRDYGYTTKGPHRAELIWRTEGASAFDFLSRGQQKCLVLALMIAKGLLLKKLQGKSCLYLVDDLASELDPFHRQLLVSYWEEIQGQVFITTTELGTFSLPADDENKTFHVEHGAISPD